MIRTKESNKKPKVKIVCNKITQAQLSIDKQFAHLKHKYYILF